jgi:hypothetical protein
MSGPYNRAVRCWSSGVIRSPGYWVPMSIQDSRKWVWRVPDGARTTALPAGVFAQVALRNAGVASFALGALR